MNFLGGSRSDMISLLLIIGVYVFTSLVVMYLAKKTNKEPLWFAWIPVLNVILLLMVAKISLWYVILLMIPIVNIFASLYVWWKVAEARGKSGLWGVAMIVPGVNFVVMGYLAFSK